ncbi:LolA family protein [Fontivita pretiosa]|uniref:LolA family protein n=1 Tax=Fontivita pretiosa TaxID=2989684 RepID=UPI003D165F62
MRILITACCALLAFNCTTVWTAPPREAAGQAAGLSRESSLDEILDALDARGESLNAFTADVSLSETDPATGDATIRRGKVWFQNLPQGQARIRVMFDTKQANNRVIEDRIEYLLSGPDLIDRTYRTRTQVTRHVLRPGEKMNLLKLGEGPFPLPIGQDRQDVHEQFEVKKVAPKPEDPPDTLHVQLTPKPGTRLDRRFKTIDVWVDLHNHMPRRIETLDRNESTIRATELTNVQINPPITDADFALPPIGQDWSTIEEAYNE